MRSKSKLSCTSGKHTKMKQVDNPLIPWLFNHVMLTLLPITAAILLYFCCGKKINWGIILGNGDLIFAAFLIVVPTLIKALPKVQEDNVLSEFIACCLMFFIAILELICYGAIKVYPNPGKTELASIIFLLVSCFTAGFLEHTYGGNKNE